MAVITPWHSCGESLLRRIQRPMFDVNVLIDNTLRTPSKRHNFFLQMKLKSSSKSQIKMFF